VPGGNSNDYNYPNDPINDTDLTGLHKKKKKYTVPGWFATRWSTKRVSLHSSPGVAGRQGTVVKSRTVYNVYPLASTGKLGVGFRTTQTDGWLYLDQPQVAKILAWGGLAAGAAGAGAGAKIGGVPGAVAGAVIGGIGAAALSSCDANGGGVIIAYGISGGVEHYQPPVELCKGQ
jgi:hypothetical protein